jgi:hypothetical protein
MTVHKCAHRQRPHFMQMSMPKPVCPNMATATPLGPPGAQTAEKQHAGLPKLDAQPSAARIRLPEGAEGLCLGAASLHSGHLRGIGPEPGTWKDPDPRRRSSRGSVGSE